MSRRTAACPLALLSLALVLTPFLSAQVVPEAPTDALELSKYAIELFGREKKLAEAAARGDETAEAELETIRSKTSALLRRFTTRGDDPDHRQRLGFALAMLRLHDGEKLVRVAEAVLVDDPSNVDFVMMAGQGWYVRSLDLNQGTRMVRHCLRRARKYNRKLLELQPDRTRIHHALFGIELGLGRYAEAKRHWEEARACQDEHVVESNRRMEKEGLLAVLPGMLLMGKGEFARAAAYFESDACREKNPFEADLYALRCHALMGDKSKAYEVAAGMPKKGLAGRVCRWARADMFAWFGSRSTAVRLLEKYPVKHIPGESEREFRLAQQTQAGLALLAGMKMKPKYWTRTRLALPAKEALDHNFFYFGADENGKPAKQSLNDSPVAMGLLMLGCPQSCKSGPNLLLQALCCWDARGYEVTREAEKFVLNSFAGQGKEKADVEWIRSGAGLLETLAEIESQAAGDAHFVGALLGRRLSERMMAELAEEE